MTLAENLVLGWGAVLKQRGGRNFGWGCRLVFTLGISCCVSALSKLVLLELLGSLQCSACTKWGSLIKQVWGNISDRPYLLDTKMLVRISTEPLVNKYF